MKTIRLLLLVLLAWPAGLLASEASRVSIPNNYSGWMNLTEGYTADMDENHQKMQVEIEGNIIHLCWVEFAKTTDERYNIWYRRSPDLGKTWDDAKVVFQTYRNEFMDINNGCVTKLMSVSGNHVHFAVADTYREGVNNDGYPGCLRYRRSTDGGATFEDARVLLSFDSGWYEFTGSIIDSDGDMVGIAAPVNRDQILHYFTSTDNGQTFSRVGQKIEPNQYIGVNLYDFQISNGHWVSMTLGTYWYGGPYYGYLYLTTSDGSTMRQQQIAALYGENDTPYALPDIVFGGNGSSYNYHPQMAIDGNTIHVAYRGYPGAQVPEFDWHYTVYQKSENFGETWSEPLWLKDSDGGYGTIAAKGQNVYVYTTCKGLHSIYYSNDGGSTWNVQQQTVFVEDDSDNPTRGYSLFIDPYDESGQHAWLTGKRYFYMETRDGFKSVSKVFSLGRESFMSNIRGNNYSLEVHPDKDGVEHWFMQYNHPTIVPSGSSYTIEYGTQDIVYRRAEAEPLPGNTNMGLDLEDGPAITHRSVIPMSPTLNLKEAMTVEFWILPQTVEEFQIAATTDNADHIGGEYSGGWYVKVKNWNSSSAHIEGGFCTDGSEYGVNVGQFNSVSFNKNDGWHHVALTYDSKQSQDNIRLYLDGNPSGTATAKGLIRQGRNAIALGRVNSYYPSKGLLDNFAIWSRALTADEIKAHANSSQTPDASSADCRLLLTFDGTLKDQSQYGNDAVALLDCILTEHEGIVPASIDLFRQDGQKQPSTVFTLDGRKMGISFHGLQKGIYIVNGQKHVVR